MIYDLTITAPLTAVAYNKPYIEVKRTQKRIHMEEWVKSCLVKYAYDFYHNSDNTHYRPNEYRHLCGEKDKAMQQCNEYKRLVESRQKKLSTLKCTLVCFESRIIHLRALANPAATESPQLKVAYAAAQLQQQLLEANIQAEKKRSTALTETVKDLENKLNHLSQKVEHMLESLEESKEHETEVKAQIAYQELSVGELEERIATLSSENLIRIGQCEARYAAKKNAFIVEKNRLLRVCANTQGLDDLINILRVQEICASSESISDNDL